MHIEIMGPEVLVYPDDYDPEAGTNPVTVPGQSGKLLRILVLTEGPVHARLIGADLGTEHPASNVNRLRKTVGGVRIRTVTVRGENAYQLQLQPGDKVDALEFLRLTEEAPEHIDSLESLPDHFEKAPVEDWEAAFKMYRENPGDRDSAVDEVRHAYDKFERSASRLQLPIALARVSRYFASGEARELITAQTFLESLEAGEATPDAAWDLLLRVTGSLPNWKDGTGRLERQIVEAYDGEVPTSLAALIKQVRAQNPDVLFRRLGGGRENEGIQYNSAQTGNLAEIATRLGIVPAGALELRNSRVEPLECIKQTVYRLWLSGILANKWVLEPKVLLEFEKLLERLDAGDDASDAIGKPVRLLIVDPSSQAFQRLKARRLVTDDQLRSLPLLRDLVRRHESFDVRLYSSDPLFRLIVIDNAVVTVSPYLNLQPEMLPAGGWEVPQLVLTPTASYPLATPFVTLFTDLWSRSRSIMDYFKDDRGRRA